jgi:hypothetical protein
MLTSSDSSQAIIIGNRRWDKTRGQPWHESPQSPIPSLVPFWVTTPVNPHLLGSDTVAGRAVWVAHSRAAGFENKGFDIWEVGKMVQLLQAVFVMISALAAAAAVR